MQACHQARKSVRAHLVDEIGRNAAGVCVEVVETVHGRVNSLVQNQGASRSHGAPAGADVRDVLQAVSGEDVHAIAREGKALLADEHGDAECRGAGRGVEGLGVATGGHGERSGARQ